MEEHTCPTCGEAGAVQRLEVPYGAWWLVCDNPDCRVLRFMPESEREANERGNPIGEGAP